MGDPRHRREADHPTRARRPRRRPRRRLPGRPPPLGAPALPEHVIAYADGASRGNPGLSSYGVVLYDTDGKEIHTACLALGHGTNNEAEYKGAIAALEAALGAGAKEVELRMDSQLVVRQLTGRYKVRNPRLAPLYKRLLELRSRFERVEVTHVPRAQNKVADKLANQALDAQA